MSEVRYERAGSELTLDPNSEQVRDYSRSACTCMPQTRLSLPQTRPNQRVQSASYSRRLARLVTVTRCAEGLYETPHPLATLRCQHRLAHWLRSHPGRRESTDDSGAGESGGGQSHNDTSDRGLYCTHKSQPRAKDQLRSELHERRVLSSHISARESRARRNCRCRRTPNWADRGDNRCRDWCLVEVVSRDR